MSDEVALYEYIAMALGHHVEAFVCLTADGTNRSLLHDILQRHRMQHTEGELDAQLKPFIGVAVLHGIIQNGRSIAKKIGVILRHRSIVLHVL